MKAEQETVEIKLEGAKFLKKKNCGVLRHGGGGGEGKKYITRYFN